MRNEPSIAVLMTCHNRSEKTLRALGHVYQQDCAPYGITVYLVDDGCTDGTPEQISRAYPDVKILPGNGTLYWGGGMARAFAAAVEVGHDFYLWLNDDTDLFPDALRRLLTTYYEVRNSSIDRIIVGSTRSRAAAKANTGGYRNSRVRPFRFQLVEPSERPQQCITFNGNCVLIPRGVADAVGGVDPTFRHFFGDIDYGLRAGQKGFESWVAPGLVGTCEIESPTVLHARGPRALFRVLAELENPKGVRLPGGSIYSFREWARFSRRHGGPLWFIYFVSPYRRLLTCLIPWKDRRA